MLGIGVGYLLLRELPIRRFHARCVIMAYCAYRVNLRWRPLNNRRDDNFSGPGVMNYINQFTQYEFARKAMLEQTLVTDGKLDAFNEWKLN